VHLIDQICTQFAFIRIYLHDKQLWDLLGLWGQRTR